MESALHAACFLGYQALKSGAASPEDLLGDGGLIHEIAHVFDLPDAALTRSCQTLAEWAKRIENKTPGYPHSLRKK